MAQKTTIQLVDDLDGTTSDDITTVTFGLDGVDYEIDLTAANAGSLHNTLAEFVASARRTGGRLKYGLAAAAAPPSESGRSKEQTQAIRDWAKSNGHNVADRGRIPAGVIDAFEEAHSGSTKNARRRRNRSSAK